MIEHDALLYLLIFIVGLIAGIINTLAGGGSLITLPVLIFMGLPASVANGTNRIAIWIQCIIAVWGFKQHGVSHFQTCIWLSIPAAIGAIVGAQFSVALSDEWFKRILAVVMIGVVFLILWNPKFEPDHEGSKKINPIIAGFVFLGIGFYGGFIQAGVGYFLIAACSLICGFNLVSTAAAKVFIVAVYTTFAVLVFIINGEINWWFALFLSLGNGMGGYIGSSLAVKRGENLIRWVLVLSVIAMSFKLLGFFPV